MQVCVGHLPASTHVQVARTRTFTRMRLATLRKRTPSQSRARTQNFGDAVVSNRCGLRLVEGLCVAFAFIVRVRGPLVLIFRCSR